MKIEIKKTKKPIEYQSAIGFLEQRIDKIHKNKEKELIWILNHPSIYTAGTSYKENEILDKSINLFKTNRGGKITYHGPGQLICYLAIDLNKRKKDIRKFITVIENSVITLLAEYKIEAKSFKDRVGIWVIESNKIKFDKERKIGAIGLRVSKWVTYHGLSSNIDTNLKYYDFINSCGLKGYKNTSLSELRVNITKEEFDYKFEKIFNKKITEF